MLLLLVFSFLSTKQKTIASILLCLLYWTWLILLISDLPVGAKKRIETNDVIYVQHNNVT